MDPWAYLEETGLELIWADLPHVTGAYLPDQGLIILRAGISDTEARATLAHELGHHALGHQPTGDPADTARTEAEADAWAASHLT